MQQVTIGEHVFDGVTWDAQGDVLYLGKSDQAPIPPQGWDQSVEGDALVYDERGVLVRVTFLHPWLRLTRGERLEVHDVDTGELIGVAEGVEAVVELTPAPA